MRVGTVPQVLGLVGSLWEQYRTKRNGRGDPWSSADNVTDIWTAKDISPYIVNGSFVGDGVLDVPHTRGTNKRAGRPRPYGMGMVRVGILRTKPHREDLEIKNLRRGKRRSSGASALACLHATNDAELALTRVQINCTYNHEHPVYLWIHGVFVIMQQYRNITAPNLQRRLETRIQIRRI